MVWTEGMSLPADEALNVQEVMVSISGLRAVAMHLGTACENQNNEFMLCRKELNDPRKCLSEGQSVTSCALGFLSKVKETCHEEFKAYAECLNRSSPSMAFTWCRNTQAVFDECMKDKLNMDRPDYGYFSRVKVHHTARPKPTKPEVVYKGTPDALPNPEGPHPSAKYGSRFIL